MIVEAAVYVGPVAVKEAELFKASVHYEGMNDGDGITAGEIITGLGQLAITALTEDYGEIGGLRSCQ